MLPKVHRLPAPSIRFVMRRGRRIAGRDIILLCVPSKDVVRFSFVVGLKVDKRATTRNRVRRLMREAVHHVLPTISPIDGVFVASRGLVGLDQAEVEARVRELLEKANVWKNLAG